MAKETTKKAATKKATDDTSSEEIITQEVKITEKVSKEVKGTKDEKKTEPEEIVTPESVGESDVKATSEKESEEAQKESIPEMVEDDGKEPLEEETVRDAQEEDVTQSDAKRATVYGDDFDAVKVEKRFSMSRLLLFILIIVTSAAIFFTGMILYQSNRGDFKMPELAFLQQATPTPTEEPTPTPSPTPTISYSDYTVEVLNGSGVSGAAGAVAGLLEGEGFEDVEVGNAPDQDYTDTEIQMQEDVPSEVFDAIAKVLSDYTVVEGDELDEGDDFDIIITVGQENDSE